MNNKDLIERVHEVWGMLYALLDKERREDVRITFDKILASLK